MYLSDSACLEHHSEMQYICFINLFPLPLMQMCECATDKPDMGSSYTYAGRKSVKQHGRVKFACIYFRQVPNK